MIRLEVEKNEILEKRTIELEGELIAQKSSLKSKAEREKLVMKIATQILSSLSLQNILDTTVKEVQQILRCNRVNIWRFENDFKMFAVAECTQSSFSILNRKVADNCFEKTLRQEFCQGNIQVVHDIFTIEMSDSHRDLLMSLQIRAEIIIPLFCENKLWGLLNASESEHPRKWQEEEIELLKSLSVQLAIAIQQATMHQELQEELKRRKAIEEQLRKSEERYATLVTSLPVGIFHTDAMGNRLANQLYFVEDGEELMDYLNHRGEYSDPESAPRPSLILLDLNMPRKDGREALKEIKSDPALRRIPIVVLTTSKAEEDILRTYDLGVSSFIAKPVVFESMVEILKTLGTYWFEIVELPES